MNDDTSPYSRLSRVAGAEWKIGRALGMLTAERRSADGRSLYFLVASTALELAEKITRADAEAGEHPIDG